MFQPDFAAQFTIGKLGHGGSWGLENLSSPRVFGENAAGLRFEFDDAAGQVLELELAQSFGEHAHLLVTLPGGAQDAAEGIAFRADGSRGAHDPRLFWNNRDEHGGDTFGLNLSLHRNDYAMANGSTAGEDDGVGLGALDLVGDAGRHGFVLSLQVGGKPLAANVLV